MILLQKSMLPLQDYIKLELLIIIGENLSKNYLEYHLELKILK